MRSILLMSLANIKKKKVQSILIAVTIMVSALLFSTAIGLLENTNKPMENMFERQEASQTLLIYSPETYDTETLRTWWKNKGGISVTEGMPVHHTRDKVLYKGNKLSSSGLFITERTIANNGQDRLVFVKGKAMDHPNKGEIWIPTAFAYANNIRVGDTLGIPTDQGDIDMKVSAIVIDPQFSGSLMDVIRIWVAPGKVPEMFQAEEYNSVMIGIRYNDFSREAGLWSEFGRYLKTPFLGSKFDYETIATTYLIIQKITGAMLLVFSAVIILVVIFIISFIISSSVLQDYKTIGILKSQGFSPNNVVMIYSGQYFIISTLASLPGIFLSYFVIKAITFMMIKSIGTGYESLHMVFPALITIAVISGLVFAASFLTSKKSGRIKPSEAIRYGEPSKKYSAKKNITLKVPKSFSVTLILSLKQMVSGKRQGFFLFLCTMITVFVFVFSVNLYNTMLHLGSNYAYWGYDNSEVTITRSEKIGHEELLKAIKENQSVKGVIPWTISATYPIGSKGKNAHEGIGIVYEGDMDSIGVMNLEGRNPIKDNEISLSVNTSKAYNKKPGDMVYVYMEGKKTAFVVTGIYQSMMRSGWTYRMQMSAVWKVRPDFMPGIYAIKMREGVKPEEFIQEMKKKFGSTIDAKLSGADLDKQFSGATGGVAIVALLLCIIFSSIAFIIIFNLTLMDIHRQKKSYGIFKSIGMTTGQIRLSIVYNVVITAVLGVLAGTPLGFIASPKILGSLIMSMGVAKFPFNITIPGTIAAVIICFAVISASAWIPTGRILKLNPRSLIVE